MSSSDFEKYIKAGKHGHMVGIGGVSMSTLAEVLHNDGIIVTGSDIAENPAVQHLRQMGIDIKIGHNSANIAGADFIVRTAACHDDNPEIAAARAVGIPVFERAQAWGAIMKNYKNAVCVSGTHGKTTTTSMISHILVAAGKDPTVMIGGTLPLFNGGLHSGSGDTIVMESCEYYNSFHNFFPTIALILNIEADHLDFFKDIEDIKNSFRHFASIVPENGGCVIANGDDKNTMDALHGLNRRIVTFGLGENNDIRAQNIKSLGAQTEFDVIYEGKLFSHVNIRVPGGHNVKNALAAAAAAIVLGIPPIAASYGLAGFTGAGRRFEFKGKYNGADIYDDYAHHPSELHALLTTASSLGYKRIICAFQPHTYSRTNALFDDFVKELKLADIAILAKIYAARETNVIGISSGDLAAKIPGSIYCTTFDELEQTLRSLARPGDLILTVGAGDIYKVGEALAR